MCGICGVVCFGQKTLKAKKVKAMTKIMAHRGPDDSGYLFANLVKSSTNHPHYHRALTDQEFKGLSKLPSIDEDDGLQALHSDTWDLFLGHRRLSIIDTSGAGHQPMCDEADTIWITYNGEIYNFKELRQELHRLGYQFKTHTDTEVLLYAYQAWGIETLKKLNGMFAFALWDRKNQWLILARDRYGIKPLYYNISNHELVFASEVKSILNYTTDNNCKNTLDKEALIEYFTFQNIFTDKTLNSNIKLLAPGHYAIINLKSFYPHVLPKEYWDFNFKAPGSSKDESAYIEELDRLFKQAVERQLIGDVEIGSYLSGGMDSGSITAIAAKNSSYLKTFTVGFDLHSASGLELAFDEREKAEHMSYLLKTEHYEMVLKSGDMERCMAKFAWHLEEPRVGQSYPNFYASKLASKFVKVVLAGVGGDELFGGYPWRYYRALVNNDFEHYIDKYYQFWQRLVDNEQIKQVFKPIWADVAHVNTRDIFRGVFNRNHSDHLHTPEDYVNHSLYFEAKTFLHGLLVVEDKLSMAHSLETRVPFLDNDLVDFSMQLPINLKLGNLKNKIAINENEPGDKVSKYFAKTNDGKLILRKTLNKYIPNAITQGIKKGFSSPDESWFKGDSIQYVKNKLMNPDSQIYHYLDYASVKKIIDRHMQGQENKRLFIWSLLNFEAWCAVYG